MTSPITATRARELLRRHGLAARRSLGQHFLVDPNTAERIVRLAGVGEDETILEIGPGLGSLTVALAGRAGRVIAVEIDTGMVSALREVVAGVPGVEVVEADALRADLGAIAAGPCRLVANLPYNVATPILARVLQDVPQVSGGLVMVQRELGERWVAQPGGRVTGSISLKVAYHASARIVGTVPPSVFLPPPKVVSVLVAFARHDPPVRVDDSRAFLAFVESAFGQRRKTIRNALRAAGCSPQQADAAVEATGLDGRRRPETLSLAEFADLYAVVRR